MVSSLIDSILAHLHEIWPVRVVDADEQGVRFVFGKHLQLLEPGVHFFLPGLMRIEKVNVKYQEIDCAVQSVESRDGVPLSLSVNVGYEIFDAVLWLTGIQHFDGSLERATRRLVAKHIGRHDYAYLQEERGEVEHQILLVLRRWARRYGADITAAGLTDFTQARQYRLFGASPLG